MPELPEVQTVVNSLIAIKNLTILNLSTSTYKLRYQTSLPFPLYINNVVRKAKFICLYTDKGLLLIHLGMTGNLRIEHKHDSIKHDHLVFSLSNQTYLIYNDIRRFGGIQFIPTDQTKQWESNLGMDPTTGAFNFEFLKNLPQNIPIKPLLMDNKYIVGIGNIYASEALFISKISPIKKLSSISHRKQKQLVINIKNILQKAIEMGGSTLKDFKNINGQSGKAQNLHLVYQKDKDPCSICNTPIKKIIQKGRSTFYCSKCQN